MHSSAVYDPYSLLTPSQKLAAAERRCRMARISTNAHHDTPVLCLSASVRSQAPDVPPPPSIEPEVEPNDDWVERQKLIHQPMTMKEWFKIAGEIRSSPSVEDIQRAVCHRFAEVSLNDLNSARRDATVIRPRQIAMYLAKTLTTRSLPDIGRRFGGRDHSTVFHAVRKIKELLSVDLNLAALVNGVIIELGGEAA